MSILLWPVWWIGVLLSVLSGWIFGWLPAHVDWFDPIGLDDHLAAAGGYTGAAFALLGAALALDAWDGPRNARRVAVAFAALYSFLALRAGFTLDTSTADGWDSFAAGAWAAVMTPWGLFHLAAGAVAWCVLIVRNFQAGALPGQAAA